MLRKFTLALTVAALMATACMAKTPKLKGVWGLNFGDSYQRANSVMTETHRAEAICDGIVSPTERQSIYSIDFFGRKGLLRLAFGPKGLYFAQFAFARSPLMDKDESRLTASEKDEKLRLQAYGDHFRQLRRQLSRKYGPATESYKDGSEYVGFHWKLDGGSVTIYSGDDSDTDHETMLTYRYEPHQK